MRDSVVNSAETEIVIDSSDMPQRFMQVGEYVLGRDIGSGLIRTLDSSGECYIYQLLPR